MEKKHYDLIISLIKEHKKYPGYETILEDIANDVYESSKVVFGTISNEDVIKAYLNKTISISIVAVPKKMNFSNKNRTREIRAITLNPPTLVNVETEQIISEPVVHTITKTKVPEPTEVNVSEIFAAEKAPVEESVLENNFTVTEEAPGIAQDDLSRQINIEAQEELLEEESSTDQDTEINFDFSQEEIVESLVDTSIEDVEQKEDEFIIESVETIEIEPEENFEEKEVNKTFVDMMINGVPTEIAVTEDLGEITEVQEEAVEIYETLESFDLDAEDELTLNVDEFSEDDSFLNEKSIEVPAQTETDDSNLVEEVSDNVTLDFETINDSGELNEIENLDDIEESFELEAEENNISNLVIEEDVDNLQVEENNDQENCFNTPSYECFDYAPIKQSYDTEEIYAELVDLDNKYPERKILQVCDLKYNHKMSVSEIAENLNFTTDDVISILSEIVSIAKE